MTILLNQKVKLAGLLFVLVFSICSIWSLVAPLGLDAPDETQHLEMIQFLRNKHRLPVFNANEEGISKTNYYSSSYGGVYYSMAYNSPVAYLPYLLFDSSIGQDWQIHKIRIVSSLLLAAFAVFLFLALLEIRSDQPVAAFGAAAILSLIPQVTFAGAYVNLEPFSLLTAAVTFYLLNRLRYKKGMVTKDYILFGIFLGLLALCKINYFIVIVYFLLLILYDFVITIKTNRPAFLKNYSYSLLVFFIINAWWWIRNFLLFRDPLIFSYIRKELINKAPSWVNSPQRAGYDIFSIFHIPLFWEGTFKGFYAYLGAMTLKLPSQFYIVALVIFIFFVVLTLLKKTSRSYLLLFLITVLAVIAYFANKNMYDFSPQGRHLFPLLIPLSAVIFLGIANLNVLWQKIVGATLVAYSFFVSLYCIFYMIDNFYIKGNYLISNPQPVIISSALFYTLLLAAGISTIFALVIILCWRDKPEVAK